MFVGIFSVIYSYFVLVFHTRMCINFVWSLGISGLACVLFIMMLLLLRLVFLDNFL